MNWNIFSSYVWLLWVGDFCLCVWFPKVRQCWLSATLRKLARLTEEPWIPARLPARQETSDSPTRSSGQLLQPPPAHRAGGLETRSCSRENQPRFNNVAARKSPKSWLVPQGESPLETAALCSCSSEQSRWDRGLPSSLLGGEPRVFPAGRATNLEEFIETNTSFYSLFLSRELSVVSLKNCQKAVIILTLDLHNTLHISEETSSPAVSTTDGGVSGCANKRRQKMCCLSIALAKTHLFLPLLSLSPLVLLHLCHPGVRTCSFLTAACSCGFSWGDEGSCSSWQWLVLSAGRSFWYLAAQ